MHPKTKPPSIRASSKHIFPLFPLNHPLHPSFNQPESARTLANQRAAILGRLADRWVVNMQRKHTITIGDRRRISGVIVGAKDAWPAYLAGVAVLIPVWGGGLDFLEARVVVGVEC